MNLTPQRKSAIAFSAVLSAVGFLAYSGLYSFSRLFAAFNALMGTNTDTSGLPKVACVFFLVYSYLIYTVVSRLFIRYNTPVRECWLAEHPEPMTGGQILAAMFRSPDFLVGLAVVFLLALPQWSAKSAITEFINYGKSYDASAARTAEFFEYVPFYLVFHTLFSLTARKSWMRNRASYQPGKAGMRNDVKQFLKFFFLYSVILLLAASLLSSGIFVPALVLVAIFLIGAMLGWLLSVVPTLLRFFRGCSQQRSFIAELNTLCQSRGWTLTAAKHPVLRLIGHSGGQTLSVSANGKTVPVMVVCISDGLASALFSPNGQYAVTHRIGFTRKITFFSFVSEYRYDFEPEVLPGSSAGKYRHVVLIPAHPSVYLADQGIRVPVDNGSVIAACRLWTPSAFLRALERGVEDKV